LAVAAGPRADQGFTALPPCRLYSPYGLSTWLCRREHLRQKIPESGQRGENALTTAALAQSVELLLGYLVSDYTGQIRQRLSFQASVKVVQQSPITNHVFYPGYLSVNILIHC
jgi:hypothetical protein